MIRLIIVGLMLVVCSVLIGICLIKDSGKQNPRHTEHDTRYDN